MSFPETETPKKEETINKTERRLRKCFITTGVKGERVRAEWCGVWSELEMKQTMSREITPQHEGNEEKTAKRGVVGVDPFRGEL